MTEPIPLFVELCAGTAAVSLRLHRDEAKPPVSRQGAKTGYSDCLLRVLGLIPGQRADCYLWCEPDPGVRLLLHAYRSAPLARAAAAIIRSWAAEDPRALWERLRAEGPPRLPEGPVDAGEVARWAWVATRSWKAAPEHGFKDADYPDSPGHTGGAYRYLSSAPASQIEGNTGLPATITPDARHIDPREVAHWAQITASNRLINTAWSDAEGRWINTGDGGATFGGDAFCSPCERTAEGMEAAPGDVPAVVVPDAREVDPREVARWAFVQSCNTMIALDSNWRNTGAGGSTFYDRDDPCRCAPHIAAIQPLPATITPDARDIDPPALPPGTVVFCDPPYQNTTPYAHDLPRAEVVAIARRWAAAGATVAISEAEPIPELVAEGWYAVEITGERIGQARTFSKQKREWVTLNRPPAWVPPVQGSLF
jgi:hypothetical protein